MAASQLASGGSRRFIASARFQVPEAPHAFVSRLDLMNCLEAASEQLTLVVGTPGGGKTAVVGAWVVQRSATTVWLSCDPTDADPVRFWSALALAVQRIIPEGGRDALKRLDVEESESSDAAASLASDCTLPHLAIVIDDFHLAGTAASVMASFIRSLPPGVRLVLTSRRDPSFPVGRLRVQGRLLEIRDEDLRFSTAEARQLFTLLEVDVTDDELDRLCALTEGWPAGLQLAGLSLARRPDADGLIRDFAESDRGVADFLVNEVLDLLPPEVTAFLMETSVLEAFDGSLCDAVTGRDGSGELLRSLRDAHLFLIELDQRSGWYRYHHLFAAFLRGRLRARSPERLRTAHSSASRAYVQQGDLLNAVNHAMAADDVEGAVRLVRDQAANQLDLESRQSGIDTIRAWLRQHGVRYVASEPRLILECCLILVALGAPDDVELWLRRVHRAESDVPDPSVAALVAAVRALHALHRGDPAAALGRLDEARRILGDDVVKDFWVSQWPVVACQAELWLDNPSAARLAVEDIRDDSLQPSIVDTVRLPGFVAWAAVVEGELSQAAHHAQSALDAAAGMGLLPANLAWVLPRLSLAAVARERGDPAEAAPLVALASDGADLARRPPTTLLCTLERARLAMAVGDPDQALATLDRARRIMPAATRAVVDHIDRLEAGIAIASGHARAVDLVDRLLPTAARALLEIRLALAAGDTTRAVHLLDAAVEQMTNRRLRVEHGLLTARALARSNRAHALEHLVAALLLAEPVGMVSAVVDEGPEMHALLEALPANPRLHDYLARLLDVAFNRAAPLARRSAPTMVEPLSDRELDALRYLASRLTYGEMANQLYISVNTLKSHVKAVYRKLGVSTRAEAVEAARRAGLL